ncbi:MAG TPA: SDR family oxidoreductase [Trebonia sp.]|nr:SDR family oxidoreductase [Trebonia sp.]
MEDGRPPLAPLFSLSGKVALVTGSRAGLGRAMAAGLAGAGAEVVLHGHHDDLEETAAQIAHAGGKSRRWIADLLETDTLGARIDDLLAETRVDILVNNAATFIRRSALELSFERWREVQAVNVDAVWLLCQRIGAPMVERGAGKIINIGSLASLQGAVNRSAYSAAKHAVAGITKALSNEWAGRGVQVNSVLPGYFRTGRESPAYTDPVIQARIPAGRFGEPEDIVGSVIFLASRAADYVTGHQLVVDGGWYAR